MSKSKNQGDTNACGGGGYKPLIVTSLTLALGMSEVKADSGIWLKKSGEINEILIDTPVGFQITLPKDSIAGILVKPESLTKEIDATLKGEVIIVSRALEDTSKNRYGIYVDNGANKTSFIGGDSKFRTITTGAIISSGSSKETYVFKNAGSGEVVFTKVRLISGEKVGGNSTVFGIYNNVNASYSFGNIDSGTKFIIEGKAGTSGDANNDGPSGLEASGIIISAGMKHFGKLSQSITGGVGGDAIAQKRVGGKGGNAYGLDFLEDGEMYMLSGSGDVLNLIVTGGRGGNGGGSDPSKVGRGNGGDAVGIYSSSVNAKLILGEGSKVSITTKGGIVGEKGKENTGVGGEVMGVLVHTDTEIEDGAKVMAVRSKLAISGTGTLALDVGDTENTSVAYGLKLEDGIFAGDLSFGSGKISATSEAYGIYSSGESTIESGKIIFSATDSIQAPRKYVFFNEKSGVLTIAGDAKVINADEAKDYAGITDVYGGVYAFGGSGTRVGTQINGKDDALSIKASITGVFFNPTAENISITLGGKLGVRGGNATGEKGAGSATGLVINVPKIAEVSKSGLIIDGGGLTLNVVGGDAKGDDNTYSHGGLATGMEFFTQKDKVIEVSGGNISLILANGKMGNKKSMRSYAYVFVHQGDGKVIFDRVTLYNQSPTSGGRKPLSGRYGICNLTSAAYDFGDEGDGTVFKPFQSESGGRTVGIFDSAHRMWSTGKVVFEKIEGGAGQSNATGNGKKGGDAVGVMFDGWEYTFGEYGEISMNVVGGRGGDGSAEGGKKGDGGDAYGFIIQSENGIFELEEEAKILLKVKGGSRGGIGRDEGVVGDAIGIFMEIQGDKNTDKDNGFQIISSSDSTIKLQVGDKDILDNNKDAYGLRLNNAIYRGVKTVIGFNGKDSWVAANNRDGRAYAVYSSGESVIEDGAIVIGKNGMFGKEQYALYNAGHLAFGDGAKIVAGSDVGDVTSNLYAFDNLKLNVAFGSGSMTIFTAKKAFESDGSGAINLTFESNETKGGAKIMFEGDVGKLGALKGSNAGIVLAGVNQGEIENRIARAFFYAKTITIKDMQLKDSTFVLAAKIGDKKNADQIVIAGSQAAGVFNNHIAVILDKYATDSTPVILATVSEDAKDKVIFNGLTKNGMSAKSVTYSGFTTAQVMITREEGENGGVKYVSTLQPAGTSINADVITPTTVALSTGLSVFATNLNSLSKRMGELRDDPYSQGIWARVFAGEQISNFGAKQAMVYTTLQVGYDYKFGFESADNYLGVAISYIKGSGGKVSLTHKEAPTLISGIISELTSCNTNGVEIAIYNSYIAHSGFYSDSVMKLGYFDNTLSLYAQPQTYKTGNFAFAISEEVGYRFVLGKSNEWFITPHGELSLGYIGESAFTQRMFGEEMDSRQEGVMILRSRVGSAWGYDFSNLIQKLKISTYVGTYYVYDCFVGGDTFLKAFSKMGGYLTLRDNAYRGSGRLAVNLGANVSVKERVKVYADFEKSFGGRIQTNYQISLGVRFGFGEKTSAPKLEEKRGFKSVVGLKESNRSVGEEIL